MNAMPDVQLTPIDEAIDLFKKGWVNKKLSPPATSDFERNGNDLALQFFQGFL